MRFLLLILATAAAATGLNAALAELNVAEGMIMSPDGTYEARDMTLAPGFKMELMYVVPRTAQGSWVPMTWDNRGRLIISAHSTEQMFRLTIPNLGSPGEVQVEPINARIGAAHGLLYAFNSLFVMVDEGSTRRNGLYRLTDTNGDDQYDQVRVVRIYQGGGQHGTHALLLTPDGNRIMMLQGNAVSPSVYEASAVPLIWNEDQLLPRMGTAGEGGHVTGLLAHGGWTASIDPEGQGQRLETMGYRNAVDFAYNKDNELFVYDSDLEFDKGTPWYRPTRITHHVAGADYGWRFGTGKLPRYYADTFGRVVGIGSGSPTGVVFGTGAKFPARYQDAMFISDWSYGNLYAVDVIPEGSSYTGIANLFASGSPFSVADVIVNPADGSLLVLVGGNANSALYRVSYTGNESTAPTSPDTRFAALRAQRHQLEGMLGSRNPASIDAVWPLLGHEDHGIRYVARTVLEWQDRNLWRERALNETDPETSIAALIALARVSGTDVEHRSVIGAPAPDRALQSRIIASLERVPYADLDYQDKLDLMRAFQLAFTRFGEIDPATEARYAPVRGKLRMPDEETRRRLIAKFDPLFPTGYRELNWEMGELLAYLEAPNAVSKMMALLRRAPTQQYFPIEEWINPQQRVRGTPGTEGGLSNAYMAKQEDEMKYIELLRNVETGWTPQLRQDYFSWFHRARASYEGGNSFVPVNQYMHEFSVRNLSPADRASLPDQSVLETPTVTPGQ
jgi:hypothetical protein